MCKASKHLQDLEEIINKINEDRESLHVQHSKYDLMISEHYHKIETMNFNACEGYYLTKQLQELLRKRRVVKDEISRLNTLNQTLKLAKLNDQITHSKDCIHKAKRKTDTYQKDWKYSYTLEEAIN